METLLAEGHVSDRPKSHLGEMGCLGLHRLGDKSQLFRGLDQAKNRGVVLVRP